MLATHRPHHVAVAKGIPAKDAMAELFAKKAGCCRGKGGSMHLGDPEYGMIPAIAIVGGNLTVAPGLGLAFKLQDSDRVAVSFFGDGASNEGAFHEGVNFLVIDPETCIDCGLCPPECPASAIFDEEDLPEKWNEYIEINAKYACDWPVIDAQKEPMPGADDAQKEDDKRTLLDPNPFEG